MWPICLEVKSILRQSRPVPSVSSYLLFLASLMVSQSDAKLIEEISELLITDRLYFEFRTVFFVFVTKNPHMSFFQNHEDLHEHTRKSSINDEPVTNIEPWQLWIHNPGTVDCTNLWHPWRVNILVNWQRPRSPPGRFAPARTLSLKQRCREENDDGLMVKIDVTAAISTVSPQVWRLWRRLKMLRWCPRRLCGGSKSQNEP